MRPGSMSGVVSTAIAWLVGITHPTVASWGSGEPKTPDSTIMGTSSKGSYAMALRVNTNVAATTTLIDRQASQ